MSKSKHGFLIAVSGVSVAFRLGAIGIVAISVGACVPDCDGRAATDQMKLALITGFGSIRAQPDPNCFGECKGFINGDLVQFVTPEHQGPSKPPVHAFKSMEIE